MWDSLRTSTQRIFKAGFVNFWRNGYVSIAAVLVMVVTLFIIGSLIFVGAMLDASLTQIKNQVDINVYFVTTVKEDDIIAIKKSIEALPEVSFVEYISREKALQDFRDRHQGDELTLQALDELGENPLGAALNVRAKNPSNYESVAAFLKSGSAVAQNGSPIIDKVNYYEHKEAIEKLSRIVTSARTLGIAISAAFAFISILIIFNTVSLAIYNSREEIGVMRLVGAGNHYIRGPFIVEGAMYGLLSAIIVLIILYPIAYFLGPKTEVFFSGLNLLSYYIQNFGQIFGIIVGSGVVLGVISSILAIRKHLRI